MKLQLLLCLGAFLFFNTIIAQQNESFKTFKMESIYLKGNKYVKNDVSYPVGLFGENLKQEMQVSPHAIAEWDSYVKFRNWSYATSITGLVLTIASLSIDDNDNTQIGLLAGGLGLSLISIPLSVKAGNQLHKSIWTRNRDLLQD